ncbi:Helicase associated domain protein [Streptomyces sp. NPDC087850]|uniref:DEAD/DEAH box helicase n=1 Tax=Streptomyces sp. NPDC087850 TaxID=3365809 RepID=UPI00381D6630
MNPADIQLRPHQKEAVTAAVKTLRTHPRASVIAACGTGKTLIAARTTTRIAPRGRVLVLVPTLDLLSQTVRSWQTAGHKGPAVAVCSTRQAMDHPSAGNLPMTTKPAELTELTPPTGPVTVYATYASLPTLIHAHRDHHLPPWDLVVVDEAHRTAGRLGKAWAGIHHDDQVPAARRLYLTATPRIWDPDTDHSDTPVASMDDETLFGPVAWRLTLSDAIDLGLLADYQILVPVIQDTDLRDWLATNRGAGADGLRLAGHQVAVLRAIHDHKLRRVLTFHHRVADARTFATTLPDTAAALPENLQPQGLWAQWISGTHPPRTRRRILLDFATHTHPEQPAILSNARVLGEGIDVPTIDAVVFADPKNSPVDTVQAVGRALRQTPGAGKKATLIVPVYLTPDEDPDDLLSADAYTPLWRTVQALRAHDERLTARLADPRTHRPTQGSEDPGAWLHFERPTQQEEVALALTLRVLNPKSAEWRRGLTAARHYHRTHHHLDAPQTHEDPDGYPLGRWLTWQRHLHTTGALDPARTTALERLGIIWNPQQHAFDRGLAHATAYTHHHGHLAVPVDHHHDGFALGRWLATQRKRADTLTPARAQALHDLDQYWNPPWPLTWHRAYHAARRHHHAGNHLTDVPRHYITDDGHRLGEWLHNQRLHPERLHPTQQRLLAGIGLSQNTEPSPKKRKPATRKPEQGLAAARAFHQREGHLEVPQRHVEDLDGEPVRLGQWISNTRRRKERLPTDRIRALDALGMRW